ncbi:MAG TPA: AIPR family protein [Terriglobales bacterium]|nr:AIPR family protein [Terriglobales bacterium]
MNFNIPALPEHVRTLTDPNQEKVRIVHALIQVSDLPKDIPLDPDPRVPKVKGPVIQKISGSLESNDGRFHLLNRGITISAREVEYDNKQGVLTLRIPDKGEQHGIIDGGHTYRAITDRMDRSKRIAEAAGRDAESGAQDFDLQYVHLEILVGIENHLADIAEARNFSVQLKNWTLAAYRKDFEWFLEAIEPEFRKYVRTSENDPEPIGILDLIQILSAVNPVLFPPAVGPIEAYKNAGKCLEYFVDKDDRYEYKKFAPIAKDVLRLYDYIRFHWKTAYNAEDELGRRGRLGARSEMHKRKRNRSALATYYFLDPEHGPSKGDVPVEKGFALPVIASFRALVEDKGKSFRWSTSPFKFFDEHGSKLVKLIMAYSDSANSDPHVVGRDPQAYTALYTELRRWYLEGRLAKLENA